MRVTYCWVTFPPPLESGLSPQSTTPTHTHYTCYTRHPCKGVRVGGLVATRYVVRENGDWPGGRKDGGQAGEGHLLLGHTPPSLESGLSPQPAPPHTRTLHLLH